jgi:hypothetical protein
VLQSAVNNSLEFASVFDFPSLGQYYPSPVGVEPGRIAESFIGPRGLLYFHQKCLDYVFLHASALPENTLGVNVNVEVTWLDDSDSASFLLGFAFGRLTVRKARFGGLPVEAMQIVLCEKYPCLLSGVYCQDISGMLNSNENCALWCWDR